MAIIQLGDVVVGIRGSVGGVTYSAAGAGAYARGWARGPARRTTAQQYPVSRLTGLGALWLTLTDEEREAWGDFKTMGPEVVTNSLGQVILLSGWQWFCKLTARQYLFTESPTLTAPEFSFWDPLPTFAAAVSAAGACTVSYTGSPDYFGARYAVIYMAWSTSAGQVRATRARRLVKADAAPGSTSMTFTTQAHALWPSLPVGGRATVFVAGQDVDGVRSQWGEASCVITA